MGMISCPAVPNMSCLQGCCCAICRDDRRNSCNSVCGFWRDGQTYVKEKLVGMGIELAVKHRKKVPTFDKMNVHQVADYVQAMKRRQERNGANG